MEITIRPGKPEDAKACGTICYEAFKNISEAHNFVPDFPSADVAIGLVGFLLGHPELLLYRGRTGRTHRWQ